MIQGGCYHSFVPPALVLMLVAYGVASYFVGPGWALVIVVGGAGLGYLLRLGVNRVRGL